MTCPRGVQCSTPQIVPATIIAINATTIKCAGEKIGLLLSGIARLTAARLRSSDKRRIGVRKLLVNAPAGERTCVLRRSPFRPFAAAQQIEVALAEGAHLPAIATVDIEPDRLDNHESGDTINICHARSSLAG